MSLGVILTSGLPILGVVYVIITLSVLAFAYCKAQQNKGTIKEVTCISEMSSSGEREGGNEGNQGIVTSRSRAAEVLGCYDWW